MKKLIEFELDGQPVYVEAEISEQEGMRRVSRGGGDEPDRAESRFAEAVARILRPSTVCAVPECSAVNPTRKPSCCCEFA